MEENTLQGRVWIRYYGGEGLKEVFVLLADGADTFFSSAEPFGVAVTTEEEAKRFVREGHVGTRQSYEKLRIFDSMNEAVAWRYPPISPKVAIDTPESPSIPIQFYDPAAPGLRFIQAAKENGEVKA